jgi:hypothetical protein
MKESDWKIFKKIKERAIDEFCTIALNEIREAAGNEEERPHDRYLKLYRLVENRDQQLSILFDHHSRSKAVLQLIGIRAEGLADEDLLSELSPELLQRTDPNERGL